MNNEMLDAALSYARRGWHVFPLHGISDDGLCTCGQDHDQDGDKGKHPVLKNGLKGATKDEAQITEWWGSDAGARWNIGIRTGEVSGITVIDVDTGPGKQGAESWAALTKEKGEPQTLMANTGGGGMHVFFAFSAALNTSSNVLGKGIDCRNDGGYIVAVPSRHRSGNRYSWAEETAELPLAHLPAHMSKRIETRGRKKENDPKYRKYTIAQVEEMLSHIDAGDRDTWRQIGIILGRTYDRSDEAWDAYVEWSNSWEGAKGRNHDNIMRQAFYELSQEQSDNPATIATIIHKACEGGWIPDKGAVEADKFIYLAPDNSYFYKPTGQFWKAEAVDAVVGKVLDDAGNLVKASLYIQRTALATSQTVDPNLEHPLAKGFDAMGGFVQASPGGAVLNSYRPATIELGDAAQAGPFLKHVHNVFPKPGDADQFLNYMAHRVQHQGVKPRFSLLLAGEQGTGKDTAVEFCVPAIGQWNVANIEPAALDTNYNTFVTRALVRVSEAANLHDMNKWVLNERLKTLIAGNPDNVTVNPKYGGQFDVRMYCGVIITTNHLATGIYIPPDDRRYDVIESASRADMGLITDEQRQKYFGELWDWFADGGAEHVAAFLNERDISAFSAENGQRKTDAHRAVVAAGYSSEYWLLDAMAALGDPELVRGDAILTAVLAAGELTAQEFSKRIGPAIARIGYSVLRNDRRADGRWPVNKGKKYVTVFGRSGVKFENVNEKIMALQEPF